MYLLNLPIVYAISGRVQFVKNIKQPIIYAYLSHETLSPHFLPSASLSHT